MRQRLACAVSSSVVNGAARPRGDRRLQFATIPKVLADTLAKPRGGEEVLAQVALVAATEAADAGLSPALPEALDALRVAITLFDADERLTWCNRHFNYLFRAMPPQEDLVGRTYSDMIRLEVEHGEIAHGRQQ